MSKSRYSKKVVIKKFNELSDNCFLEINNYYEIKFGYVLTLLDIVNDIKHETFSCEKINKYIKDNPNKIYYFYLQNKYKFNDNLCCNIPILFHVDYVNKEEDIPSKINMFKEFLLIEEQDEILEKMVQQRVQHLEFKKRREKIMQRIQKWHRSFKYMNLSRETNYREEQYTMCPTCKRNMEDFYTPSKEYDYSLCEKCKITTRKNF